MAEEDHHTPDNWTEGSLVEEVDIPGLATDYFQHTQQGVEALDHNLEVAVEVRCRSQEEEAASRVVAHTGRRRHCDRFRYTLAVDPVYYNC